MNKCIAFVDDDRQVCRYFREYAIYRGYECHCYHEAENALKAIVRNREGVWAICVDLTLPGSPLQGPELITELRVRGVTAPVVIAPPPHLLRRPSAMSRFALDRSAATAARDPAWADDVSQRNEAIIE